MGMTQNMVTTNMNLLLLITEHTAVNIQKHIRPFPNMFISHRA